MPHRVIQAWAVVVGAAGLVLVGALVLLGADVVRAGRTGPRWKRRLVTAALALLAAVGIRFAARPGTAGTPGGGPATRRLGPAATLREAAPWKRLLATWKAADDVASGRKGAYPFDAKGKQQLLAALRDRASDVESLAALHLLTRTEADLLKGELLRLTRGVRAKRTVEERTTTCYEPMWTYANADDSLRRLRRRLPLLQRVAEAKTVKPAVMGKVLATVDADLENLARSGYVTWLRARIAEHKSGKPSALVKALLKEPYRLDADKTVREARALARRIKGRLGLPVADKAVAERQWQAVNDAWRVAEALVDAGRCTRTERAETLQALETARQAIRQLGRRSAITDAEADLLQAEANLLTEQAKRLPGVHNPAAADTAATKPLAEQSFLRLRRRLPLLRKVAERGKADPAVMDKVLPTVRLDLGRLSDPQQARTLGSPWNFWLKETLSQTKAAVAKIEKLLEARR